MNDNSAEYKRLYDLYIEKSDEDLMKIINPENEYTPIAIEVASDILEFCRGITPSAIQEYNHKPAKQSHQLMSFF